MMNGIFLLNFLSAAFIYILLTAFCSFLLFLILKREYFFRKECWLSFKIKEAESKLQGRTLQKHNYENLLDQISQLYYPTWFKLSVLIIFLTLTFEFLISFPWIQQNQCASYSTLVPLQIGIVALVFPIIIFIIGFSNNKAAYGVNLSEVLLRESCLFPVAIVALFFSVDLIWAKKTPIVVGQIIVMAITYACVLVRVIRLILSDERIFQKSCELLKDKMKRVINNTIENRLGNNILMESLGENKIELDYAILDLEKKGEEYIKFNIKQKGSVISDINLISLEKIAKIIENSALRNGFSFYKNTPNPNADNNEADTSSEKKPLIECKERYLKKRFMESLEHKSEYVLSVNKKLIKDKSVQSQIESLVARTFRLRKFEEDGLTIELGNLKDQLIDDIRNKRLGRINKLRSIYLILGELFLDIMKDYSSNYTMEMARKERENMFSINSWAHLEGMLDDLRDIYEVSLESKDKNIIRKVAHLPIALSNRSIRSMDHFMFQKSFAFLSLFYQHALEIEKKGDKDLSDSIKERVGTYLRETADYSVQFELNKIEGGEYKITQYKDFAIEIYSQLQNLLKIAYDAKDIGSFERFVTIGQNLFSEFSPSDDWDAGDLKWHLQDVNLTDTDKERINKEIKEREFILKIENEIKYKKWEMFFGLTSLILSQYAADKTNKDLLRYYKVISARLPSTLPELTQVFLNAHSYDVSHFWGWDWWELPTDGKVYSIDFMSKTLMLYALKSLEMAGRIDADKLLTQDLPASRDFMPMIENDESSLKKIINGMVNEISQWNEVLSADVVAKKDALFKLFDKVKEKQVHIDEDALINAEISQKKKTEFINTFIESYKNNNTVHRIFEKYGIFNTDFKDITRPPEALGYNQIDEKGAFIDDWHVGYHRWGEQYGNGMATSENGSIFGKMFKEANAIELGKQDVVAQIESAIEQLITLGYSPNVIIASLEFEDLRGLTENGQFTPYWHKDIKKKGSLPNFQGYLKLKHGTVPVYKAYKAQKGSIGIFDLRRFATLTQLNPLLDLNEKNLYEQFKIEVIDLNKDNHLRNDILTKNPEWLNKYADKDRFLRTKVVVKAFTRQEFKTLDKNSGVVLRANDAKGKKEQEE